MTHYTRSSPEDQNFFAATYPESRERRGKDHLPGAATGTGKFHSFASHLFSSLLDKLKWLVRGIGLTEQ
jgi:hypothetical protein